MTRTEAEEILREAASTLGKPSSAVDGIVQRVVVDNWIDTAEALKVLTPQEWDSLKIPLALQSAVHHILNQRAVTVYAVEPAAETPAPLAAGEGKIVEPAAETPTPFTEVSYGVPTGALASLSISDASSVLQSQLQTTDAAPEVLYLVDKIITNILQEPSAGAKRKVRRSALEKRAGAASQAVIDFLESCGFVIEGDWVVLPVAWICRLTDGQATLRLLMRDANLAVQAGGGAAFNPYQSSVTATAPKAATKILSDKALRAALPLETPDAELKRETLAREKLLNAPPVPLATPAQVTICHARKCRVAEIVEEDGEPSHGYSVEELTAIKQNLINGPNFRSRAKDDLKQLRSVPVGDVAAVRVAFPDEWTATVEVPASAPVAAIHQALRPVLLDCWRQTNFELYLAPPVVVLNPEISVRKAGLVPAAKVFFRLPPGLTVQDPPIPRGSSFINPQLISPDMIPPPLVTPDPPKLYHRSHNPGNKRQKKKHHC